MDRAAQKRLEVASRKARGLPTIWVEPRKTTREQRAAAREAEEAGERKINEILSKDSHSKPGRKSDPRYDKADYRAKIAQICGNKLSTSALANSILSQDKSYTECKVDKMKQALKRRKKK